MRYNQSSKISRDFWRFNDATKKNESNSLIKDIKPLNAPLLMVKKILDPWMLIDTLNFPGRRPFTENGQAFNAFF
ncbi:MAG: hypothetical protein ACTSVI_13525 [Promethearchaeota archaeon]